MARHTNPSKFVPVPSVWNRLKIREILYGAVSNFHLLYSGWELQLRGKFWQGPFFDDAAKSQISQIYFL